MQEGRKAEVLSNRSGHLAKVKVPAGEFYIHPKMLEHIQGLERTIDSLEEDRVNLIAEMKVRGEM